MKKEILTLNNISYSYHNLYGETAALKDLSFSIYQGEFLAIVGPSGCCKTTLLSIIAGLLKPEEGTVNLLSSKIGYMLQKDHLFPWLSIYNNVTLGLKLHKIKDKSYFDKIEYLLKEYELYDFREKYPDELSGGMKQRAALIRTLALDPDILLLDEPFSALDYQTKLSVSQDIGNRIRKTGKTAILITHDISEALRLSDRILILSKRPATIRKELQVHHEAQNTTNNPLSDEYSSLFNEIWEELQK